MPDEQFKTVLENSASSVMRINLHFALIPESLSKMSVFGGI